MNIIIKKNEANWRPLQPTLDKFKTLSRDGKFDPTKSVESQYSEEELRKISNAVLMTKALGSPSINQDDAIGN